MFSLAVASYLATAIAFMLLLLFTVIKWRACIEDGLLLLASAVMCLWALFIASNHFYGHFNPLVISIVELLRNLAWIALLLRLLFVIKGSRYQGFHLQVIFLFVGGTLCCFGLLFYSYYISADGQDAAGLFESKSSFMAYILLALVGLFLLEQWYRNISVEQRWASKFLCLGIACIFVFDFFLYSDALLFSGIDADFWDARGIVNVMAVPLIGISISRSRQWLLGDYVSHRMVLHSAVLVAGGLYLFAVALGGYYIRVYGGGWGKILQVLFFFASLLLLLALVFSGQLRAQLKVFVGKHFFSYKYDYREQWASFIRALSMGGTDEQLRMRAVQAIADIVESPGGGLWLRDDAVQVFLPVTECQMTIGPGCREPDGSSLVTFLERWQWVVNLGEYERDPGLYKDLELPQWLRSLPDAWIVVPLMRQTQLLGFIVLTNSRAGDHFNWEDIDLLRIAGRELAGYLALLEANRALLEARQFEAFNRLSAYVVHDLKNVIGQLSLVVENSKKHKDNPEFIEDAFSTVDNATNKMQRMLAQLRIEKHVTTRGMLVKLGPVVEEVVLHRQVSLPHPIFEESQEVEVLVDRDRLASVIEHVIENAQEATPDDGKISVRLVLSVGCAVIKIEDNGCGMSQQFVRERLFRPFDTTKGNAGMGIGVYECREFIRSLGGEVEVKSQPDKGTLFCLHIPLAGPLV